MTVQGIGFLAHALKHAAIQEYFFSGIKGEQVFGTRHTSGSTVE
jgi:hypothetical protein